MDASKPFDPWGQFAEMQRWMTAPFRYEGVDPTVYEIAVLAAMHSMAGGLQNSTALRAAISTAIKERADRLGS